MAMYEEVEPLIPKIAFQMLILVLVATDVFILVCTQTDIGTEMWMFYVTTIIFAAMIALFYIIRLHITVSDKELTVKYLRTTVIPLSDIIDYKTGDIDVIRNYSGWGMKKVQFKNYICHGYEKGVSFKIMGRIVLTVSSADPEALIANIPKNKEEKIEHTEE